MSRLLSKRIRIVLFASLAAAATVAGLAQLSAAPKKTTSLQLPANATVQKLGSGRFHVNGFGVGGTYSCSCNGENARGSCSTKQDGGVLKCGVTGDSCTGSCEMTSTTGGSGGHSSIF